MSDHHHHHSDVVVEERVVETNAGSGMNALVMLLVLVGIAALAWWLFTGPFQGSRSAPVQNNNPAEQVIPDQPNVQPQVPDVQEPASPGGGSQIPTGWIAPVMIAS